VAMAGHQSAGRLTNAVLEEMIMRGTPAIGQNHPGLRAIMRQGVTALCKAWTVHTLRRAIADVASTSEQDYREFGLDKAEILAALKRLRAAITCGASCTVKNRGRDSDGRPLTIIVTKGARGSPVRS
jgi:hypothetical protein